MCLSATNNVLGNIVGLGCEDCNVQIGEFGQIQVEEVSRQAARCGKSTIFAVGDVTGPPGLASSAMQQGRAVAQSLFANKKRPILSRYETDAVAEAAGDKEIVNSGGALFGSEVGIAAPDAPLTIWTIPEMASVGEFVRHTFPLDFIPFCSCTYS